jgi:NADP-dependent 3-hydroxy acid dehydrogenase YdfG
MVELKDKVALIVGAGSGLSASIARLFAQSGMRIALAARSIDDLTDLVVETGAKTFACDAT